MDINDYCRSNKHQEVLYGLEQDRWNDYKDDEDEVRWGEIVGFEIR